MRKRLIQLTGCALALALLTPAGASALNNGDPCSPYYTQSSAPIGAYAWTPDPASTADAISFDGSYSSAGGAHKWTWVAGDGSCESTSVEYDPISSYSWDFGDGTTSSSSSAGASHQFAHPGTYTVKLTVTEQNCQGGAQAHCFTDSVQHDLTIANQAPNASFQATAVKFVAGKPAGFDASASLDPDGTIATYHWDFGDGHKANSTAPLTSHTFVKGGPKSITLTVTDDSGAIDAAQATFRVAKRCVVPNVVGKNLSAAKTRLKDRSCTLGHVKHKHDGHKRRHRVLKQSAPEGGVLPAGTPIGLTVGK
jgi:hypothetical protein